MLQEVVEIVAGEEECFGRNWVERMKILMWAIEPDDFHKTIRICLTVSRCWNCWKIHWLPTWGCESLVGAVEVVAVLVVVRAMKSSGRKDWWRDWVGCKASNGS